ncbi:MAG TPA: signal peptidase I [Streptosporangiaceae bacterium]
MNEERGTRDDQRAEAGRSSAPGDAADLDGHQPAPPRGGRGAALANGPGSAGPTAAGAGSAAPGSAGPRLGEEDQAGTDDAEAGPGKRRDKGRAWWVELPILLAFALVLALLIKTFVVQAFFIPSSSMENTLEIGDKVLVNKLVYDFRPIHRGDIIVFNGNGSWYPAASQTPPPLTRLWDSITGLFGTAPGVHDLIKRVIGIPGDHVVCCDAQGRVTVNGVPLNEKSYLYPGNPPSEVRFSVTVPPGRLWVMGDHRNVSWDSRGHQQDPGNGSIPEDKVVGRAFMIVAPVHRWGVLSIPATFEQPRLNESAAALAGGRGLAAVPAPGPFGLPAVVAVMSGPLAPVAPLGLGLAGAFPLTWLQFRLRRRLLRRSTRSGPAPAPRRGWPRWPGRE